MANHMRGGVVSYRREISLDGIGYATTAVETGNRQFYSFWYCQACNLPGSQNKLADTLDEAHELAKADLTRHHDVAHSQP